METKTRGSHHFQLGLVLRGSLASIPIQSYVRFASGEPSNFHQPPVTNNGPADWYGVCECFIVSDGVRIIPSEPHPRVL